MTVDQAAQMTGPTGEMVRDTSGVLWRSHRIVGVASAELAYPKQVTCVANSGLTWTPEQRPDPVL